MPEWQTGVAWCLADRLGKLDETGLSAHCGAMLQPAGLDDMLQPTGLDDMLQPAWRGMVLS